MPVPVVPVLAMLAVLIKLAVLCQAKDWHQLRQALPVAGAELPMLPMRAMLVHLVKVQHQLKQADRAALAGRAGADVLCLVRHVTSSGRR